MAVKNVYKIVVVVVSGVISVVALLLLVQNGLASSAGPAHQPAAGNPRINQDFQVITPTDILYLPLAFRPITRKPLGNVVQLSGPTSCGGFTAGQCYTIQVSCPSVSYTLNATIKYGNSLISSTVGTVMFYGGYDGTYFWEGFTSANPTIITDVRTAGFQTVQIKWAPNGWLQAPYGNRAGLDRTACRTASVARWVYDTFHQSNPSLPYCTVGHSNGATAVAYSLTHYGLDEIIDEAILESGPNFSLLEYECINTPGYTNLFLSGGDRIMVDTSFGIYDYSTGPCLYDPPVDPTIKPAWRTAWQEASIINNHTLNIYPHTMVSMIFGSLDTTSTRYHGEEYANWLAISGTPFFTETIIAGAGHGTTSIQAGQDKMTSDIINGCILR